MYAALLKVLPARAAEIVAAVIYTLMILAILYTCVEPQAEFSYLRF
jgi:hypothetical protein